MHARQSVVVCRVTEPAGNSAKSSTSFAPLFFVASGATFFGASAAALTAWVFFDFDAAFFVFAAAAFAPRPAAALLPTAVPAFDFFAAVLAFVAVFRLAFVAGIGSCAVQSAPIET